MKMLFKSLFAATALVTISLSMTTRAETVAPQAVDQVDIRQYAGKWYEIAHLPMYFQRKCVLDISAHYTVNADQTMGVLNSCRIENGKMISSEGVAYPQNQGNSKLKVSFLPPGLRWIPFTKGHYWVLRVDPEYKVALVGGPSTKYLWILSREPQLDEAIYKSYLETAKYYGYDITKLIKLSH
ncbi:MULTISPECIES: lipocalin family protein [unclassified Acinetobacter]|uniref:lipocalin family protein n=1 Tax=unclassified Acinetobacter TaxID=196816 RepID=UPI0015D435B0|nr:MULTISPECIES: lipocalin family protein [unclassified Acinetobacter]UUS61757.1 lipocalin family protein [Acinetobacter sp. YH16056_T]